MARPKIGPHVDRDGVAALPFHEPGDITVLSAQKLHLAVGTVTAEHQRCIGSGSHREGGNRRHRSRDLPSSYPIILFAELAGETTGPSRALPKASVMQRRSAHLSGVGFDMVLKTPDPARVEEVRAAES